MNYTGPQNDVSSGGGTVTAVTVMMVVISVSVVAVIIFLVVWRCPHGNRPATQSV